MQLCPTTCLNLTHTCCMAYDNNSPPIMYDLCQVPIQLANQSLIILFLALAAISNCIVLREAMFLRLCPATSFNQCSQPNVHHKDRSATTNSVIIHYLARQAVAEHNAEDLQCEQEKEPFNNLEDNIQRFVSEIYNEGSQHVFFISNISLASHVYLSPHYIVNK